MRFSYFGVGVVGTTVYSFWSIIHGSILMSIQADSANAANDVLTDAKSRYKVADSLYTTAEANLLAAQMRISNANCYVTQYSGFTGQIIDFCTPAAVTTNHNTVLEQRYSMQIIFKPNVVVRSERKDFDVIYYTTEEQRCSTDSYGKETCKTVNVSHSDKIYYTVKTVVYLNYGTVVTGSGAKLFMGCGQFDHGLEVSANIFQKSTTDMKLKDKYNEEKTTTFSSNANANVKVDNQLLPANYEVETSNTNYQQIAIRILALIEQQCKALNSSLKAPDYYAKIATDTTATLPSLQTAIGDAKENRDQAAAYRDGKQALYDSADSVYKQVISTWLPVILVPIPIFILLLICFKESLQNKYFDTQDCCAPSVKEAIPVARFLGFLSKNPSRSNIQQIPEFAAEISSEIGGMQQNDKKELIYEDDVKQESNRNNKLEVV